MAVDRHDIKVGVAGWSYEDWKGTVYPASERNPLRYLSRYVNCIEINTSFYRPVNPGLAFKWLRDIAGNRDFVFTAKLWRRFTHDEEPYSAKEVRDYVEGVDPLFSAGKLAALLFQFPFYFKDNRGARSRLSHLAEDFARFPRVLEVRDNSWAQEEALDFLKSLGYSVANLDMPTSRNSFTGEGIDAGKIGYLRLHGRNYDTWFKKGAGRDEKYDYLYSDEEIDELVERIERIRAIAQKLIVIANNHYIGQAAVNSLQIINRILRTPVAVPPALQDKYPQLRAIAKPEKDRLF